MAPIHGEPFQVLRDAKGPMASRPPCIRTVSDRTFDNSPTVSNSFFFSTGGRRREVWSLVCHFAASFRAFLRMSFHIVGASHTVRRGILLSKQFSDGACGG